MEFTSQKLKPAVATALQNATITQHGSEYRLITNQLSRKDYEQFAQVIQALRGAWVRPYHRFNYDPKDRLNEVLKVGMMPQSNPLAFFPTPQDLCEDMAVVGNFEWFIPSAEYRDGFTVLEPSAGDGSIANWFYQKYDIKPDCVELDSFNREILTQKGFNLIAHDFLVDRIDAKYDLIIMNPPFKGNAYLKHIKRAFELLKVGGKIVAICPDSIYWQDGKLQDEIRNLVAVGGYAEPPNEPRFEHLGTSIKTCILEINKLHQNQINELNSVSNGYPSWHCEQIMIALDSHWEFWQDHRKCTTVEQLERCINEHVRKIQKDSQCLFNWSSTVQKQVLDEYTKELAEDGIELTGVQQLALV